MKCFRNFIQGEKYIRCFIYSFNSKIVSVLNFKVDSNTKNTKDGVIEKAKAEYVSYYEIEIPLNCNIEAIAHTENISIFTLTASFFSNKL